MKKLIIILLTISNGVSAQNNKFIFPENQQSDLNNQQLYFELAGTPKELYHKTINFLERKYKNSCVIILNKEEGEILKIETNSKLYKWQGTKTCVSYQVEFEFKQGQIGVSVLNIRTGNYDIQEMCSYNYIHKPNGAIKKNKKRFTLNVIEGANTLMSDMYAGIQKSSTISTQNKGWLIASNNSEK
ncbi:MAG: hypothetical protein EVA43_05900 [Flavobacteriales bacterium]|nr:MAG: hypothetical protein EVA43_05900 [Flavobacteriales bacterium]